MNSPVKHHFNPAFSLKPWAVNNSQICEMKRVNGRVLPRHKHPNATGFQKNLYRTDGVDAEHEQHLELNVMKPLDTAAERALKKILSGDSTPWNSEERSAWTRYILSLMFRNPHAVQEVRRHVREMHHGRTHPTAAEIGATNLLIDINRQRPTGADDIRHALEPRTVNGFEVLAPQFGSALGSPSRPQRSSRLYRLSNCS
jgi:hypothetical protein